MLKFAVLGRDDGKFFKLQYGMCRMIMILTAVGVMRLILENAFNIIYYFYNPTADIIFSMIAFVIFLNFFGAAALHAILSKLGAAVSYEKLLALIFNLQVLHLVIPFADYAGVYILGMPLAYQILPESSIKYFVYYKAFLTPGVLLAWAVTFAAITRFLLKQKIKIMQIAIGEIVAFNLIFWPTYLLFPAFNASANALLGIRCDDYFNISCFSDHASFQQFWGYGLFMLTTGALGTLYYKKRIIPRKGTAARKQGK